MPVHDLACVVHLHSTHSDGTGSVAQIVDAAKRSAVDVVLLTDHDTLAGRSEEGWHETVLLLVGEEISPFHRDHTLAFGLDEVVDHDGMTGAEVAAAAPITFAAHPFSLGSRRYRQFEGMPHTAPGATTGVELWSYVTDTAEAIERPLDVVRFVVTPDRVVDHPPRRNLDEWDRLCARGPCVAIGGLDAHQVGVRVGRWVPLRLMAYRRSFRYLRTHVLCRELPNGELEHDRAQVYDALREGSCYIARDSLAPARGFAFWADGDVAMGAQAAAKHQALHVRLARPAEIRLLRDGREDARARDAAELDHETSGAGVYRVEARVRAHGRDRTWILSNPIYLTSG